MKLSKMIFCAAAICLLVGPSFGAPPGQGASRAGLGINLNRADARLELDSTNAVSAFIGFDSTSNNVGTLVEFGAYYLKRMKPADPVSPHLMAGLSYSSDSIGLGDNSLKAFTLFAGLGAEYFLPGTKSLSIEGDVGLLIQFLSDGDSATRVALGNLAGGMVMLRYYFDLN